jgi:Mg/Co/Ni transporter MgtE
LDEVIAKLKEENLIGRKGKVTVSSLIHNNEKELSKAYQQILNSLEAGMYSQPFENKSRAEHTTVYRILYVQEKIPGGYPTFKEMEPVLKERLLNQVADQETELYLKKLREHFYIRDQDLKAMVPDNYQPFILK